MPLSFLNPWLWLGALAVVFPLWLHLRAKQQRALFPFSTLRFLQDAPRPQRGPLKLVNLPLLLLRLLAVLLIAAGFSWPYFRTQSSSPVHEHRVYLLDNTLSRQAGDSFLHDRDRVIAALRNTPLDSRIAVVELTSTPKIVAAFSDDRSAAEQKLQALSPSFERGSFLSALRTASTLLAGTTGKKRLIFLTDNQANQWTENSNAPPFLTDIELELPSAHETLPNVGLSEPHIQRVFTGDKAVVTCSVKLTHSGSPKAAKVIVRANGQTVATSTVDFQKQAGTVVVQAQWEADPSLWLRGEAELETSSDALAADNRVYFSLQPLAEGSVALLAKSPYLKMALSSDVMRGEWRVRNVNPASPARPELADVLCLESGFLQGTEARKLLSDYLEHGKGVLLLVNQTGPAVKGTLDELGFSLGDQPVQHTPEKFQFILTQHPIFHPFLSPDFGNLMEVNVSAYERLNSTDAVPLMFSEKGAGLFFQSTRYRGKLFVAALGLDREHTSWPIHPTFIPFLDLTLQAARGQQDLETTFEPGELSRVALPKVNAPVISLFDGDREIARFPVEKGAAEVRLPERPGLYSLQTQPTGNPERLLAVNPPPKESALEFTAPKSAVAHWTLKPGDRSRVASMDDSGAVIPTTAILNQGWWWWMLLAGALALFFETGLAALPKEKTA